MTEGPSLSRLIKLIGMAGSKHDNEALTALRLANQEAEKFGGWQKILSEKITVIGDPFLDLQRPVQSAARPRAEARPPIDFGATPATSTPTPQPWKPRPRRPVRPKGSKPKSLHQLLDDINPGSRS